MRHVDFSPLYRSTVGFDRLFTMLDSLAQPDNGQTYPPYNIERTIDADGTEKFLISIAVAGFSGAELEVIAEDNQLLVRGRQKEEGTREFLHRGIAARQFQRSFLLAEGVEVGEATLRNGMLIIAVVRPKAAKIARRIEIRSA